MSQYISGSFEETIKLGIRIGKALLPGDIVAMEGDLGAGKTSLTKGIAHALDIPDEITSPTYTLISEYEGTCPLYHMDMYRIESVEEFEMMGVDELLFGNGISLIEWSERVDEYLPPDRKRIRITIRDDGSRMIDLEGIEI